MEEPARLRGLTEHRGRPPGLKVLESRGCGQAAQTPPLLAALTAWGAVGCGWRAVLGPTRLRGASQMR